MWDPIQYQSVIIYPKPRDSCSIIENVQGIKSGRINVNLKDKAQEQDKDMMILNSTYEAKKME
jgi:hypothetical protein